MSMKTVPYRSSEVDTALDRPAPWWKRAWLRVRAWWWVHTEDAAHAFDTGRFVRAIEERQRAIDELARVRLKASDELARVRLKVVEFEALAANAQDELRRVEKAKGAIWANLAPEPPPIRQPGPGRKRLG